ncbi:MAG: NAD+ synthase, partial [Prolixibacteraceae bacterium]|nr:NAD+ synthase [Prolixibacteraceae bacterium]
NYHVGNFPENSSRIIAAIGKAKEQGADLVLFSELSVCGYYPNDLLERLEFIQESLAAIEKIASVCHGIAALVGGPSFNPSPKGKMLFNSAFFLKDGAIKSIHSKTLLPTYDVFDEYRHFESNKEFNLIELNGCKIAVTICEDLWFSQKVMNAFGRENLYATSPMEENCRQCPDLVVNLSASPFSYRQERLRKDIVIENAVKYQVPVIYVNQVGAQTELIFDGGSFMVDKQGKVVKELAYFVEDFAIVETLDGAVNQLQPQAETSEKIYQALVLGIADYFGKSGFSKATLGLSGGIDSALTLVLAVRALGAGNVKVLLMPSQYSSDHSVTDAVTLAHRLGVSYDTLPIHDIAVAFDQTLAPIFKCLPNDLTEENIQARVRGILLMAFSNKFGNILLNTSNKSEAAVGYGTLYGDMNGGLSVLGDLYKTEVYQLSKYINREEEIIPVNTILKPPSAELRPGQKDSDSLPDYELLDAILYQYIDQARSVDDIIFDGFDETIVRKVVNLVNRNEYKRFQAPPTLRVSSKAFGFGRKMPIVARYPL